MDNSILISIIVSAYNIEQWIERCIESIRNQSYKNLEIIVIDDGSTDRTPALLDACAKFDKRIIVVHQKNSGLVAVREKGITMAKGCYVGFVDGDDVVEPDMYERLLNNAVKYHAEISHCGIKYCFYDGRVKLHWGTGEIKVFDRDTGVKELLSATMIEPSLCNKLYKRELLYNSCLDRKIVNYEDLLRNFVLFQRAERTVYEDFCPYQYWRRENSMSNNTELARQFKHIIRAKEIIVENSPEIYQDTAVSSLISSLVNCANRLVFSKEKESKALYGECRRKLITEKKHLGLLLDRQKTAARLIILCPMIHKWVYRIYLKRK